MNKFIRGVVLIGFGLLLQNSPVFAVIKCIDETVTDTKIKYADEVLQACDNNDLAKIKSKLLKSGNPTFDKTKLLSRLNFDKSKGPVNRDILPFSSANVFKNGIYLKTTTGMAMHMRETGKLKPLFELVIDQKTKKPEMVKITSDRLTWSDDLRSVGLFLRVFAPKSESLRNAWNEIMIADFTLLTYSRIANREMNKSLYFKTSIFSKLISRLKEVGDELTEEEEAIRGVKLWVLKDTKAARDVILATIPAIQAAIQRMIKDYDELKKDYKSQESTEAAVLKASEEEQRINQESAIVLEAVQALHDNRSDSEAIAKIQQENKLKIQKFMRLEELLEKSIAGAEKLTLAEEAEMKELEKVVEDMTKKK